MHIIRALTSDRFCMGESLAQTPYRSGLDYVRGQVSTIVTVYFTLSCVGEGRAQTPHRRLFQYARHKVSTLLLVTGRGTKGVSFCRL